VRARIFLTLFLLTLSACKHDNKPAGSLRVDPSLEALVPPDSVFLAGANVDAIRDTVVYQKLLSRVPLPQLDAFTKQTGLDPRKDLSQILSCSNGKRSMFMARGVFKIADLEKRLEAQGAARSSYKGKNLFGSGDTAIFFLDSSTAVAGPIAELQAIVDRGGHSAGPLPAAMADMVRSIPSSNQIWAVLSGGGEGLNLAVPDNSNLANVMQVLKSIDSATLGMDLRNGFDLLVNVSCKTDRDAKFVHDMVKGVVGLGRLNTPDNRPELLKLYDAISVQQQQSSAQITAKIPTDLADKFLDLWLKR